MSVFEISNDQTSPRSKIWQILVSFKICGCVFALTKCLGVFASTEKLSAFLPLSKLSNTGLYDVQTLSAFLKYALRGKQQKFVRIAGFSVKCGENSHC